LISWPLTGWFSPVPTHESAWALSPRVPEQLGQATALEQIAEERCERSGNGSGVHAARLRADAPAPRATAEEPAENILQAAPAAARSAAEQPAEQVLQPPTALASAVGGLGQAAKETVQSAHARPLPSSW
jgi:hypothetical protein